MNLPLIFVHTPDGQRLSFRVGLDTVHAERKVVEVVIAGTRYEIKESKQDIENLLRDVDILERG